MPVLSRAAHMVLMRIEIEHAHHGGADNGRLPVTYQDFKDYGVHPRMTAPAIRELEALGLIEVTERGSGGNAEFRRPSLYRLTYRNAKGATGDGTHEWRQIKTREEAEAIAERARNAADQANVARSKKTEFRRHKVRAKPPSQSEGEKAQFPPSQSDGTAPPSQSDGTIYISGRDTEPREPLAKRALQGAVASERLRADADAADSLAPIAAALENLKIKIGKRH